MVDSPPLGAFVLALLLALADWIATARGAVRHRYLLKPLAMVAIMAAASALILFVPHDPWQAWAFLAGLTLSLVGDILLLLPDRPFFLPGLVAFLLAHVCYIIGLNQTLPPLASAVLLLPLALLGIGYYLRLATALRASGHARLQLPVAVYALAILLMLFSALSAGWRADWQVERRVLLALGASLFFLSDGTLAWNRFVHPLPFGNLVVMVTYHLGQLALAGSLAFSA